MAFPARMPLIPAPSRRRGLRGVVSRLANPYAPGLMRKEEELLPASGGRVAEGQLRRQVRLGSKAVYRVCACEGDYARVEVVEAPGLRSGAHYKFTRAAVELMELVDEPAPSAGAPAAQALRAARAAQRQRR